MSVSNARLIHTGPLINAALCWPLMKGQECPPATKQGNVHTLMQAMEERGRGKSALRVHG